MNIIIKPYNPQEGLFYFKPDTTLNRDYTNLYLPHFIKRVAATELFYIRIDRAGKGIAERYASRYFSKGNYALSISIAPDIIPNTTPSQAPSTRPSATPSQASSAMPSQAPSATQSAAIINRSVSNSIDYSFYSMPAEKIEDPQLIEQFCKYIAQITEIISLRTGDIIAIETGKKEYFSIEDSLPIPTSNSSSTSDRLSNKETDPKAGKQEQTGTRRCQITCFPNLAPVNIIF
ncbi:hypothetical protein MR813_01970 [bacterium]|nr:hypothetical protein [bacterium]